MKTAILTGLILGAFVAGCGSKSDKTTQTTNTPSSESSSLNAPADYLKGLAKGQQSAVKTVDVTSLTKAIDLFQVDKGRNPKDLNELVAEKYIPKIPDAPSGMKIVYDANAGAVKVVKQ